MNKGVIVSIALLATAAFATAGLADTRKGMKIDGAREFKEHCAVCHPDGGNIVNPAKTLKRSTLAANGVRTWKDIVAKMRNPGPGMTKFEKKDVSDKEARAIAEYVLKSFK